MPSGRNERERSSFHRNSHPNAFPRDTLNESLQDPFKESFRDPFKESFQDPFKESLQDSFNNFLDDYFNHSFRVPVRRPLLSALAALIAAIGVVLFLFPPQIPDLEAWRGSRVTLAGTIRALEPKLEGEDTVWRMTLSDISLSDASLSDSSLTDASPADKSTADTVTTDRMPADTSTGDPSLPDPDAAALSPGKKGLVLCVLDAEPQTDIGARVEVCGTVIPFRSAMNEGEFDVRLYYHILRIDYSLRDVEIMAASKPAGILAPTLFHVRKTADDIIDRCFSQRNAPTIKAILLGEKGLLDEDTKDLYQGAGIIHILSISGLHLSLIGMGLFGLLGKLRLPLPGQNSARRRSKSFISPSGHPRHDGLRRPARRRRGRAGPSGSD